MENGSCPRIDLINIFCSKRYEHRKTIQNEAESAKLILHDFMETSKKYLSEECLNGKVDHSAN